jgi:hypothetical protein
VDRKSILKTLLESKDINSSVIESKVIIEDQKLLLEKNTDLKTMNDLAREFKLDYQPKHNASKVDSYLKKRQNSSSFKQRDDCVTNLIEQSKNQEDEASLIANITDKLLHRLDMSILDILLESNLKEEDVLTIY